ncbi:5'-nucleotidase, lipoprotein e(P4) family [Neobacillus sp. D3-1R]|uniref:5'-nucleotidase, lipoprotein e(P4) family n=1 Tax=Neobacillus sp. D3-1R TaxID=3445778 RepID=UPI003FA16969
MKKLVAMAVLTFSFILGTTYVKAEPIHNQNMMSVLWFQTSGEAKALYYQGYNIGKMRLDEYLSQKKKGKKPAVVLDIDETILDNSPFFANAILTGKGNTNDFFNWFNQANDQALPGAVEFLQYADSKGVDIFYISNRHYTQTGATIRNLQLVGAPQANTEHVLLKQPMEKGKETRRQQVAKTHEIVLLFGDNLGDFQGFDQLPPAERVKAVDRYKEEFGKKFIVFPNPMYGDWEDALYNYDGKRTEEEYQKLRKKALQPPIQD